MAYSKIRIWFITSFSSLWLLIYAPNEVEMSKVQKSLSHVTKTKAYHYPILLHVSVPQNPNFETSALPQFQKEFLPCAQCISRVRSNHLIVSTFATLFFSFWKGAHARRIHKCAERFSYMCRERSPIQYFGYLRFARSVHVELIVLNQLSNCTVSSILYDFYSFIMQHSLIRIVSVKILRTTLLLHAYSLKMDKSE